MIEKLFKQVCPTLHNESGKVFYSGRAAFSNPSKPLYILGLNPGGDDDETILQHTQRMSRLMPEYWSAYRDEKWGETGKKKLAGTHGM